MDKKEFYKDIVFIINSKKKMDKDDFNLLVVKFNNKYINYYNNKNIKNKILFFKININKDNNKDNKQLNVNERKLFKLKKVIKIYYLNISDYDKITKISKIYSNYMELWEEYCDLIVPLINTKFIKDLNKVFLLLKKYNKELDFINYYDKNMLKMSNNLPYAKYILQLYLDNNITYNLDDFLYFIGIDRNIFNYCIYTVMEFDMDFYNKFSKVKEKNDLIEINYYKKIILDLFFVINNNGIYPDGTLYTKEEFYKRIFYKYDKNFGNNILKFVKKYMDEYYEEINLFLKKNGYLKKGVNKEITIDKILNNNNNFIDGKLVTNDDKLKVITYMNNNNLPLISDLYYYLLIRKDKIKNDINNKKNKKMILIP